MLVCLRNRLHWIFLIKLFDFKRLLCDFDGNMYESIKGRVRYIKTMFMTVIRSIVPIGQIVFPYPGNTNDLRH